MSRTSHLGAAPALLSFVALAAALAAQGTPIGFEETYALSGDRAKAVATLIPGTDDWYYYQCRERQDARDFASVRELLGPWIQRHGRNARVLEIENRQALLDYDSDPERAYALLRDRLGLRFQHQRQSADENAGLPTQLDPELISPRTLAERALRSRPGTVDGFTDHALPALLQADLTPDQLHSLLSRLLRPDVDNLPAFVVRDLDHKQSRGFGSLGIHKQLRLDQLEQCAQLRPSLLQENEFVQAMLTRLLPTVDVTWQDDPQLRAAQLQRLYSFTQRLSPAFNSLKAHVLFHYLRHDLGQGAPDKQRFLAYIQLPRDGAYVARDYVRRFQRGDLVNLGATFPTGLPAAGDDSALIRACLEHFFATEDSYEPYATFLFDGWLKAVLAETKLLLGQGDPERWYSLRNDPAALEQLEQRVEITFPPTQQTRFAAGDPVTLSVDTKNVPTLLVKVFAIDAYRYHVEKQKEVDATIELDGVVPNVEQTVTYDEPPLRRVRRTFDLPMLTAPGTYVVEFVGNGISSRAVIHKGGLRHVERTSAAGQVFRVYDEAGAHQMGAAVWFGGREYGADDKGEILVPFSTDPGTRQVVLRAGNRSSMASFAHDAESYDLRGNVHVDREALIAGKKAKILVRPQLTLRDRAVSLRLLQDAMLVVVATDLDGRRTPQEVRGLTLTDDGELVHEITVPERLQRLEISLQGKVKDLAGKDVELRTASSTFAVNGMDNSAGTTSAVLLRGGSGYEIELRGKDGEVKAGKPVQLQLLHRDFRDQIGVTLATDARGRIALGKLADITSIYVQKNGEFGGNFMLVKDAVALPTVLHGLAGETLRVPYRGAATQLTRATFSLLGQDRDYFSHLGLNRGFLELRDLPAGDYWLALHDTDDSVTVRITEGKRDGDWLVGRERTLQASSVTPLTLTSSEIAGEELQLRLANATAATRVHVIATRAMPAFDLFADLRGNGQQPLQVATREIADSSYEAGRKLGDEYRYVLERRFATKFPGNMLTRPSLLVNPWRLTDDSWNDAIGLGGGAGGKFGGRGGGRRQGGTAGHGDSDGGGGGDLGIFANLDYLPTTSNTLANLRPDANGIVHVPLAPLDAGNLVHVLVLDGEQAVQDTLVLDEQPLTPRARHLQAALDSTVAYAEHKRIEFVAAGGQAPLGDPRSTEIEMFDSLAGVHRALLAVNRDADLTRFAFLLQWPTTSPEQKLALYEQYACHELHFFLYQKDREFFDAVVRPALLCKRDKTFLDRWLLGDDLRRFLDPWAFAQLNLVEKILLARRLDDEGRGSIARLVREQLELRPVATERLEELFDLAFQSNSLNENQTVLFARIATDPAVPTPGGGRGGPGGPATGGPGGPTTPGRAGQAIGGPGAPPAAAKPQAPATRARRELQDRKAADKSAAAAEPADQADMPQLQAVADSAIEEKLVDELGRRGMAKQLYRAVDPTRLLVEQNYWQRRLQQATPDVVAPSQFWADYATAPAGQPFVSAAVLQANGSFLEMMMALAVLDLPFEAGKHEFVTDGDRTTLKAATPLLLVKKEVTATEAAADQAPLLLGENFFRLDDRYRYENGEQRDAFVTDEFLTDVAYGCQVVVTNPTSSKRIANVLLQVPAGAVPVQKGFWTRGVTVELQPYATAQLEYAFYFPGSGDFAHYPAHAAEKGKLAANASARTLHVVDVPSKIDTGSWEHVSQEGSAAEVLTFLDNHNVQRLELPKIAWRMKDRAFFTEATKRLRDRHVYDDTLWSYAVLHRDPAATREYLEHQDGFLAQCGAFLQSRLVDIDPVERKAYQHVELDPLVHQRAHQLGSQRRIGNRDLAQQYGALMNILGYKPQLASEDWIATTYYFLLQDRVEDALAAFAKVQQNEVTEQLQYDYLAAYLCFYTADTGKARRIAERYRDYPVAHWNKRFGQIRQQLDEIDGKAVPSTEPTGDSLAATAPSLEMLLDGKTVRLSHKNLAQCEVRYYPVDVEFAFSAQPFASSDRSAAAYVQPILSQQVGLAATTAETAFELPAQFHNKNVLVEVRAAGLVRSQTFFANALAVRFLESYGQVAVSEAGGNKPLPKTYVKVFARLPNGQVRFHKDGYTDLRGRFDYASLSDDPNRGATRYAVLVMHEQRGAVIRELDPPTR